MTVILCRQQGRQSEAAGLDISNIIGVPSPSVRVRVKGLLEEQFENTSDNQAGGVPGGAGAETAAVAITEAEAGIPRKPVLVARLVNLHLVKSSLPTKRSSPWQGGVGDQSGLPSPSNHSQSPPVTYSGIFADCFEGQPIVAVCTLQHPRNGTLMPLMVLMELSTISTSWVITTLSTSSRTYRSSLMVIIVSTNNIVNNIRDDHLH